MARKLSNMGGGRFEYHPKELNRRDEIRRDVYASAFSNVWASVEQALATTDEDIVTRGSLEEWLGRRLVEEFIKRRER